MKYINVSKQNHFLNFNIVIRLNMFYLLQNISLIYSNISFKYFLKYFYLYFFNQLNLELNYRCFGLFLFISLLNFVVHK